MYIRDYHSSVPWIKGRKESEIMEVYENDTFWDGVRSIKTATSKDFIHWTEPVWLKYPGSPDGLKVDQQGNLFATGPGGVYVITPKGELLGRVHTGKATSNCAWGSDGSVLYMTVDDCLYRLKTKTKGANWKNR